MPRGKILKVLNQHVAEVEVHLSSIRTKQWAKRSSESYSVQSAQRSCNVLTKSIKEPSWLMGAFDFTELKLPIPDGLSATSIPHSTTARPMMIAPTSLQPFLCDHFYSTNDALKSGSPRHRTASFVVAATPPRGLLFKPLRLSSVQVLCRLLLHSSSLRPFVSFVAFCSNLFVFLLSKYFAAFCYTLHLCVPLFPS
jgi:hypothetical protein